MNSTRLVVTEEEDGRRLDSYAAEFCEGVSRARIQALIAQDLVLLNGETARASTKVRSGDTVVVFFPEPVEWDVEGEPLPLDVVYEDQRVLVINKGRGMVVHPSAGHRSGTLVNAVLARCPDLKGIGGEVRPGIVHRLDKDTTGLLVVAKDEPALRELQRQISSRVAKRQYLALCKGRVKGDSGVVEAPIGRDLRDRKKMAVVPGGRDASTGYSVVTRFGNEYTLVVATLRTGRTHQVRVHMAYIRHPIVGDPVYSRTKGELGMEAQALHAFRLGLELPDTQDFVEFTAPLPDDFKGALSTLQKRYGEELPKWVL